MRAWLVCALLAGCGGTEDEGPALTPEPAHASMFGQSDVTFSGDLTALGEIRSVTVGGVHAWNLRATPQAVTVTLQGASQPGTADVEIDGANGRSLRHAIFTYDPPPAHVPLKFAAFGASLTMGMESMGLDARSQTNAVSGQIARALGVDLALPLFQPNLLPPLTPDDFNPDCTQKASVPPTGSQLPVVLTDPKSGKLNLRLGRIDPSLTTRNFAIGGSTVSDTLFGVQGGGALLERVVEDPDTAPADAFTAETVSQIDRVERLDPDIAWSADLLANDLDSSTTQTDDLHIEMITPLDQVQPLLMQMMQRLGHLHGVYFIANMPSMSVLPNVGILRAKRIAAGLDTPQSYDAKMQAIEDLTNQYNAALADAMRPYPNLILVDFHAQAEGIRDGVRVGGELLTTERMGGLLSLDDVHFTDTGYALFANQFIGAISDHLNAPLPLVDVAAVHAADPLSPANLRAAGLTCVPQH
jgi:hypothetical protein